MVSRYWKAEVKSIMTVLCNRRPSRWGMVAIKRTVQLREMGLYLQHRLCL